MHYKGLAEVGQASGKDAFWMCLPVEIFQAKWEETDPENAWGIIHP